MAEITQEQLKDRLHYDPDTGVFRWRSHFWKRSIGTIAGRAHPKRKNGPKYWAISIHGKKYGNSGRLAWLYMTGALPGEQVDHRNRIPTDNRWGNLRLATPAQNQANKGARCDNKSGRIGVIFHKEKKKWMASISVAGRQKYLGYFTDREVANAAYLRGVSAYRGEFAVLS